MTSQSVPSGDTGSGELVTDVTDPAQLPVVFMHAFNSGDLDTIDRLFEPGAIRVLTPGEVVTGEGRRNATRSFLGLGIPIKLTVRHAYVYDDLALLLGDFLIEGTKPDGEHVRMEGTATDVVRRDANGFWRYAIDNPPGIEREVARP
ncbi:YybH family protein [Streptomyces sp. NPDC054933]